LRERAQARCASKTLPIVRLLIVTFLIRTYRPGSGIYARLPSTRTPAHSRSSYCVVAFPRYPQAEIVLFLRLYKKTSLLLRPLNASLNFCTVHSKVGLSRRCPQKALAQGGIGDTEAIPVSTTHCLFSCSRRVPVSSRFRRLCICYPIFSTASVHSIILSILIPPVSHSCQRSHSDASPHLLPHSDTPRLPFHATMPIVPRSMPNPQGFTLGLISLPCFVFACLISDIFIFLLFDVSGICTILF
jgi:hypothetical protein